MSSIDLVILGMVIEKPQSAYDIQKDVEYHQLPKWTKISIPSVYKKVVSLKEKGYLSSETLKGEKATDKVIYSVTPKGRAYFMALMNEYVSRPVPIPLDFNVVITNLNKVTKLEGKDLLKKLEESLVAAKQSNRENFCRFQTIPTVGRTVFEQQLRVYDALLDWLAAFRAQYLGEC